MPRFATREEYEAWKSGQHPAGTAATAPAAPAEAGTVPAPAKPGAFDAFRGLPGWAWPFIVACIALPVVNLGGAVPGGLGFGGAAGCAALAKKPWEVTPRVLACAGVTAGVWLAFLLFAVLVVGLSR